MTLQRLSPPLRRPHLLDAFLAEALPIGAAVAPTSAAQASRTKPDSRPGARSLHRHLGLERRRAPAPGPGVSGAGAGQPAAQCGSDAGYAASVLKMISGWIIMVGNIFPVARPRSRAESGRSAHPTRRVAMSVYRVVIDVVGTSTSPARRLPLTRSKRRASRSGTFGSPRSPSKAFTSGRRRSHLPRRSSCPSSTSRKS
jgi:hypothetical protein